MGEIIKALKDTPIPTILVVAGIVFLLLAVAGQIAGKVNVPRDRQRLSMLIGVILIVLGAIIYMIPQPVLVPIPAKTDIRDVAIKWPLVKKDTFSDTPSHWGVGALDNGPIKGSRRIIDGRYRWEIKSSAAYHDIWSVDLDPVNDFYLAVDARLVSGDPKKISYGLMFRNQSRDQGGNILSIFYNFLITDIQKYIFSFSDGKQMNSIIEWLSSSAIHPGEYNRLEVVANGSIFYFYINGQALGYAEDNRSQIGLVGLSIETYSDLDAVLDFDNFELRRKPLVEPISK
jgi:hypothetical protein